MFYTLVMCFWLGIFPSTLNEEIPYNSQKPLEWTDFSQRIGGGGLYKAFSYTGIRYVVDAPDGKNVKIEVIPYFIPLKSWVHKDFKKPELLNHEQRHFDLTAIHAGMLDSVLRPYEVDVASFMDQKLNLAVEAKFDSIYSLLEAAQDRYDKETNHSTVVEKQEEWNFRIDSLKLIHLRW